MSEGSNEDLGSDLLFAKRMADHKKALDEATVKVAKSEEALGEKTPEMQQHIANSNILAALTERGKWLLAAGEVLSPMEREGLARVEEVIENRDTGNNLSSVKLTENEHTP